MALLFFRARALRIQMPCGLDVDQAAPLWLVKTLPLPRILTTRNIKIVTFHCLLLFGAERA